MYRKMFLLISIFVVLGLAGSASAVGNKLWIGTDTNWFNANNWDPTGVPEGGTILGDTAIINGKYNDANVVNFPVISSAGAECKQLWLGNEGNSGNAYLTIEGGGELTVNSGDTETSNQTICLGRAVGTHGIVTMNGGQINMTVDEEMEVGGRSDTGQGTYNVYGGIHNGGSISLPGYGGTGPGVVNLDGGVIDSNAFQWSADNKNGTANIYSGTLSARYVGFRSGGYCNLYGGVIDCNNWLMWANYGGLDIYDGMWITRTQTGTSMTYHGRYYVNNTNNAGDYMIRSYGGRGTVAVEWTNMTNTDPNQVIAESELSGLISVPDPNGEIYWWARTVFDPNVVFWPEPVDGFSAADPDQEIYWTESYSGNATHHDIYLGTSFDDVNDANLADPCGVYIGRQTVDNNSIARVDYWPSGLLELGGYYYWRIDEVNEADEPDSIWKGPVWSFSISYFVLDDFEDYVSDSDLQDTWVPAFGGVVFANSYRDTTVTLGDQSMRFETFTNTGSDPRWGEARQTFAADQKWDPANTLAKLLAFSVYGHAANGSVNICVKLKDSAGNEAVRYLGDPCDAAMSGLDPNLAQNLEWTEVFLNLDGFTSPDVVDLSKVSEIAIGVEASAKTSTKTILYVDNLRLYLAGCHPLYLWSDTDFNADCITNLSDVDILVRTGNWLMSNWDVTPAAAGAGPVLKYDFDGDVTDSSGNGYDATIYDTNGIEWAAGHLAENPGALVFDGNTTEVNNIPLAALSTVSDEVTVSFWMYGSAETGSRTVVDGCLSGGQFDDRALTFMFIGSGSNLAIGNDGYPNDPNLNSISSGTLQTTDIIDQWNHYAVVKDCDANHMAIYVNGELVGSEKYPGRRSFSARNIPVANITRMVIGDNVRGDDEFSGMLDDFRIYDYAMTQGQVAGLAGKVAVFTQPLERLLQTGYNYNPDVFDDDMIDFKDYAMVAKMWLVELLYGD